MTTRGDEGPDPVSVAITRRVKPGQTEAFEAWLEEIRDLAARFDGCMGMDVIRPADASTTTYVVIVRFDSYDLYTAWHQSPERAEAVGRSAVFTVGDPAFEEAHGPVTARFGAAVPHAGATKLGHGGGWGEPTAGRYSATPAGQARPITLVCGAGSSVRSLGPTTAGRRPRTHETLSLALLVPSRADACVVAG